MFVIRNEQIRLMGKARQLTSALLHIRKFFPDDYARLGAAAAERMVAGALERARSYGLVSGRDALQFVTIAIVLGEGFDQLPWAREILNDRDSDQTRFRSTRLYTRALRHLEGTA